LGKKVIHFKKCSQKLRINNTFLYDFRFQHYNQNIFGVFLLSKVIHFGVFGVFWGKMLSIFSLCSKTQNKNICIIILVHMFLRIKKKGVF